MKLAVLVHQEDPFSLRICRKHITKELSELGVDIIPFAETDTALPACDLIWEPGLSGDRPPHPVFKDSRYPIVSTIHGTGPFTMKWKEIYPSFFDALKGSLRKRRTLAAWRWFREKNAAVIAVSAFSAHEVSRVFALPENMIHTIHHGVDHDHFHMNGKKTHTERPYLLSVAQYRPAKNVGRLFAAYACLPEDSRPDLVTVLTDYCGKTDSMKGLKVIRKAVSLDDLVSLYRGALGFVFPSLYEGFGMPILEAMACGCPVITSSITGCAEVAGDSALLVDPRSVDAIAAAMRRLIEDSGLRESLSQKGLAHVRQFTWRKSAEDHLKVFNDVLNPRSKYKNKGG